MPPRDGFASVADGALPEGFERVEETTRTREGSFHVAGGGDPETAPPTPRVLAPGPDPHEFRAARLDAIRGVR